MNSYRMDRTLKVLLGLLILLAPLTAFAAFMTFVSSPPAWEVRAQSPCAELYTVQQGDTLAGIAATCGVSVDALAAANPAVSDQTLAAGQVINVPGVESALPDAQATALPDVQATGQPTTAPTTQPTAQPGQATALPAQPTAQPGQATALPAQPTAQSGQPEAQQQGLTAQGFTYTVRQGDTLSAIAARYNVSLQALINANPQISNPHWIYPGQRINIPSGGTDPNIPPTGGDNYIIRAGDTLSAIASRFGVTVAEIMRANPEITNPNIIYIGQAIRIPGGTGGPEIPPTGGESYTVRAGDTLASIALRYQVTVGALLAANPQITNPNLIYPGQVLVIPTGDGDDDGDGIPDTGGDDVHIVQPGDTLRQIAWLYGTTVDELMRLNPQIANANLIYPGQVINLP